MKVGSSRLLLVAVCMTLLSVPVLFGTTPASAGGGKVEICHIPPGNPDNFHTIKVSENAVSAHLAHGDFVGACDAVCNTLCDDGDECTIDDNSDCEDVGCPNVREPVDCDDEDLCTADSCDPATGCENEPVVCGEGQKCNPDTGGCETLLTCPCWQDLTVSALAEAIDDSAQGSTDDGQHVGLVCAAGYAVTPGNVEAGAHVQEGSNGDGTIPGIGVNLSYLFFAGLECLDSNSSCISCDSPDVVFSQTICQFAEYDAATLANNRNRMTNIGIDAAANCTRELDAAFRLRTFVPRCGALVPAPDPLP